MHVPSVAVLIKQPSLLEACDIRGRCGIYGVTVQVLHIVIRVGSLIKWRFVSLGFEILNGWRLGFFSINNT